MPDRAVQITGVVVLLIAVKIALGLVWSPADIVRAEIESELARVPERAPLSGGEDRDFAALCNPVLEKPSLWQELVSPPPPPAPKEKPVAVAPPDAPDLKSLLVGLVLRPGQIGRNKMQVITPTHPEGAWMSVGDTFNGCRLKSFTREEAVFSFFWEEQNEMLEVTMPRPLR